MEGEPKITPEFLPQKPHSWDQLKEAVLNNLEATLDLIPQLPIDEMDLKNLEKVEPGTYLLKGRPSSVLMRELPKFAEGAHEVGLFCIQGKWLISVGRGLSTELPDILTSIQHERIFQLDIHSHPGTDPGAEQPSSDDILKLNSTIDGYNYIISEKGLIEFRLPANLPGGFTDVIDHYQAWGYWITKELKLTEDEFNRRDGWELKRQFYEKFFGMRIIPWENESEIEKVLDKERNQSTLGRQRKT